MIASDYIPNYDFVTCQDWIEWINGQEITLGQPCVKEDKKSRLMPLESRVTSICLAQPANARFNPDIRRLYLPKSAEQFINFLISRQIYMTVSVTDKGYRIAVQNCNDFAPEDIDMMKVLGKVLQYLKKNKRLK